MPRKYVRKTDRGRYGSEVLQNALIDLRNGISLKATSKKYGIDRRTLRRHKEGKVSTGIKILLYERRSIRAL